MKTLDALLPSDRRRDHPRFGVENINKNKDLIAPLEAIATAKGCAPAQVALAWLLEQGTQGTAGNDVLPIPGTKQRRWLEQNCAALDVRLDAADMTKLNAAFPLHAAAGTRYPEKQLKALGI